MHTRRFLVPLVALAFLVGALGVAPRGRGRVLALQPRPEGRHQGQVQVRRHRPVAEAPAAGHRAFRRRHRVDRVAAGPGPHEPPRRPPLPAAAEHGGEGLRQERLLRPDRRRRAEGARPLAEGPAEHRGRQRQGRRRRHGVHDAAGDLGGPSEGHPGDPGPAPAGREPAGRVALRGRRAPPVHLQGLQRRAAGVRRRVPDRVLRRRRRQLHLPALQRGRVDVPAVRERQARRDAELPEVVAEGLRRRRAGLHDRPPGLHAAPEHAGALQVPPRPGAAVRDRQRRDARGGGEEVDGAERRERPPGQDRALRHPEQPQVPARPAEGPAGPGRDGEEGSGGEAAPRRTGEEPGQAEGTGRRVGHHREVPRGGAPDRRRTQLHRERRGPELDAVRAGAPDGARGLQPVGGRRGGRGAGGRGGQGAPAGMPAAGAAARSRR